MAMTGNVNIIPGNFIGIAKMITMLSGGQTGRINAAMNVPVMIIGVWIIGKKLLVYSAITVALTSLLTDLWTPLHFEVFGESLILTVAAGAVLMGMGVGLILRAGGTTGGTTTLVRIIAACFPLAKMGNMLILLDGLIISAGALLLHDFLGFVYSILYEVILCRIIDRMNATHRNKK